MLSEKEKGGLGRVAPFPGEGQRGCAVPLDDACVCRSLLPRDPQLLAELREEAIMRERLAARYGAPKSVVRDDRVSI